MRLLVSGGCRRADHEAAACCAGELYPTSVRTTAHGISAGTAKVGALWAVVWFNYLQNRTKFWLTASFNFGGMLLTALFMPDPVRCRTCRPPACTPCCRFPALKHCRHCQCRRSGCLGLP